MNFKTLSGTEGCLLSWKKQGLNLLCDTQHVALGMLRFPESPFLAGPPIGSEIVANGPGAVWACNDCWRWLLIDPRHAGAWEQPRFSLSVLSFFQTKGQLPLSSASKHSRRGFCAPFRRKEVTDKTKRDTFRSCVLSLKTEGTRGNIQSIHTHTLNKVSHHDRWRDAFRCKIGFS